MPKKTIREKGKIRLELIPAAALFAEAIALEKGNEKPGRSPFNWRRNRVLASDQAGGAMRHLARWLAGEDYDEDGVHHLAAMRARGGIILDAIAAGTLVDDRVPITPRKRRRK